MMYHVSSVESTQLCRCGCPSDGENGEKDERFLNAPAPRRIIIVHPGDDKVKWGV
jgi:hypothetical protein